MPHSARWARKQHLDVVIKELTKAGQILMHIYEEFNDGLHEEWAQKWYSLIHIVDALIDTIQTLRDEM